MKKIVSLIWILFLSEFCSGCVKNRPDLYSGWGEYNQALVERAKQVENPIQTIDILENVILRTPENRIPPGLSAHLGLLYLEENNQPKALEFFMKEGQLFPESQVLIKTMIQQLSGQRSSSKSSPKISNKIENKKVKQKLN